MLTPKKRRFITEYLKDQNGTQAAIRAGYSKHTARTQASALLTKHDIKAEIEGKLKKHEITADRVIAELSRLALSDVRSIYNEDGSLKPISEWPEDVARCVAAIEQEEIFEWKDGERENVGDVRKVKLWDKPKALEILARHFKLLTDNVNIRDLTYEKLLNGSWREGKDAA